MQDRGAVADAFGDLVGHAERHGGGFFDTCPDSNADFVADPIGFAEPDVVANHDSVHHADANTNSTAAVADRDFGAAADRHRTSIRDADFLAGADVDLNFVADIRAATTLQSR